MGGSAFGPHRRERIVFLGKFGDARLGRLKKGLGGSNKTNFHEKCAKTGKGENVLGPHRRERIAVLAELWKPAQISPKPHRVGGQSLCKGLNI